MKIDGHIGHYIGNISVGECWRNMEGESPTDESSSQAEPARRPTEASDIAYANGDNAVERTVLAQHEKLWAHTQGHPGSLFQIHLMLQDGLSLDEALAKERSTYQMLVNMACDTNAKLEVLKRFLHADAFVLEGSQDALKDSIYELIEQGILQWNGYAVSPVHAPMATAIKMHVQGGSDVLNFFFSTPQAVDLGPLAINGANGVRTGFASTKSEDSTDVDADGSELDSVREEGKKRIGADT